MSVQVLSDLDGQLLAVAEGMPGKTHDRTGCAAAGYGQFLATTELMATSATQAST